MKAAALAVLFLFLTGQRGFAEEASWKVSLSSREVFQGDVIEIRMLAPGLSEAKGFFRHHEIPFFPGRDGFFIGLVGLDLEEKPGLEEVKVVGWEKSREAGERVIKFEVLNKRFPEESISVPSAFDQIDDATWKRIQKEQKQMADIWTIRTPGPLWEGRFLAPVSGAVTSAFGLRRIVNGSPRSPHGGVDLKAPLGTEIVAANRGRVVLREEFFFTGKTVVIDHGGGLYTMYFHLADFHVEKGSEVGKGELIGWAGMTGRATGPHLHWGARLNGARIDPFQLVRPLG